MQKAALQYLTASVPDPALQQKLVPNYTFGCKRVLISNDYYPALLRPNVEVINAGIREITDRCGRHSRRAGSQSSMR